VVAYAGYLHKTFWPRDLAVFYPHPRAGLSGSQLATAALVLLCISGLVLAVRRPYLFVGWLWYIGTLVPVIGLVQVGGQALADRYTYVPLIGIFIVLAWGVPDLLARCRVPEIAVVPSLVLLIGVCTVCTWGQVGHWRSGLTLWEQTLRVTGDNPIARNNLGVARLEQDDVDGAIECFSEAVQLRPHYAVSHHNLGNALLKQGKLEEAREHTAEAVRLDPDLALAQNNLGVILFRLRKPAEAVASCREAVRLKPDMAQYHRNLAVALQECGQVEEADAEYQEVTRLQPGWEQAVNTAAWFRATARQRQLRHGAEALHLAKQACGATSGRQPEFLDTLAAAYAETGQFDDAVRTAQKALELAASASQEELAQQIARRLRSYKARQPYHQKD